jgi:hypothetical protein
VAAAVPAVERVLAGGRQPPPQPIDFLVFDDRAWQLADRSLFRHVTYGPADQDEARHTPSDHCTLAVDLRLG